MVTQAPELRDAKLASPHLVAPVISVAGLAGLVGIVLLVWRVPPALYAYVPDAKDRAAAEASTRTGLIAGLPG